MANEHLLDERLIDLLHEERVALGFLCYQPLEWGDAFVVPQQRAQHLVRTLLAQGIEAQTLANLYLALGQKDIIIETANNEFTVKLPLIKQQDI